MKSSSLFMSLQVAQVAAYVLGVPLSLVKVKTTETMIGANSSVTGASIGTDLCAHVSIRKARRKGIICSLHITTSQYRSVILPYTINNMCSHSGRSLHQCLEIQNMIILAVLSPRTLQM